MGSNERSPGHRLSCVLPAYNEAASLTDTVARWSAALQRYTTDYEIIVIDDGSTDDTAHVVSQLVLRHEKLRVVTHPTNLGYGAAIASGFAQATFSLVLFSDAD